MAIDTAGPRSRRAVLLGALGAVVATAASTLGRPAAVRADNDSPVELGVSPTSPFDGTGPNQATTVTKVHNPNGTGLAGMTTVNSANLGDAAGLYGQVANSAGLAAGVMGTTTSSEYQAPAIYGHALSNTQYVIGVLGVSEGDIGSGTAGYANGTTGFTIGAEGDSVSPNGVGTWGWNSAGGTGATGVVGGDYTNTTTVAQNTGVLGVASDATGATIGVVGRSRSHTGSGVIGVIGETNPAAVANTGVYGTAPSGRGAQFAGGKAQLRLVPSSTANTHPHMGQLGDLFVDKSGRLWFCKGTTTWKQIA